MLTTRRLLFVLLAVATLSAWLAHDRLRASIEAPSPVILSTDPIAARAPNDFASISVVARAPPVPGPPSDPPILIPSVPASADTRLGVLRVALNASRERDKGTRETCTEAAAQAWVVRSGAELAAPDDARPPDMVSRRFGVDETLEAEMAAMTRYAPVLSAQYCTEVNKSYTQCLDEEKNGEFTPWAREPWQRLLAHCRSWQRSDSANARREPQPLRSSLTPPNTQLQPDVIYAQNAYIDNFGRVHTQTRVAALRRGCFMRNYQTDGRGFAERCKCVGREFPNDIGPAALHELTRNCHMPRRKRVLVISQIWVDKFYHFMIESLPRLGPWLGLLRSDDEMVLHIKVDQETYLPKDKHEETFDYTRNGSVPFADVVPTFVLRYLQLLGVGREKIIVGHVLADEVLLPEEGVCEHPSAAFWSLALLRREVLMRKPKAPPPWHITPLSRVDETDIADTDRADIYKFRKLVPRQPSAEASLVVLVLTRTARMGRADSFGDMQFLSRFTARLLAVEPAAAIDVFSDIDTDLVACPGCIVSLFQRADVIVGYHGAGLTHIIFSRPGTLLLEVGWRYDPGGKRSSDEPVALLFQDLAWAFGLKYKWLPLPDPIDATDTYAGPMVADLAAAHHRGRPLE